MAAPDGSRVLLNTDTLVQAVRELRAVDEKLAKAIDAVGPCTMWPRSEGTHFDHIARSIVYQQLSGKAAATIYGRFVDKCGKGKAPTAQAVLTHTADTMRECGLSTAKVAAVRDLAHHVANERLPIERLEHMDDDAVVDALVQVRGIGVWTAQMFLMFRLGRPNVLPVLDLGVRKGAQRIYRMRKLPEAERLEKVARAWHPWRSVASWYCWRILDVGDDGGW